MSKYRIEKNSDADRVKEILEGLKETGGYCPCRLDRTPDTKCMCKEFRDQQTSGLCHCGLYNKVFLED